MDSKSSILTALEASGRVAPFQLIPAELTPDQRVEKLLQIIASLDLEYPVVLKPDYGERGSGVTIAHDEATCSDYLHSATETTIVQKHIPGVEYGVFYERFPNEEKGRITGITHKAMTTVTGNGTDTLEKLILLDPRAVCQAAMFFELQQERLHEVIPDGEIVKLNFIGTHSRGSLFLDASDAWTEKMEQAIDEMSKHFSGFHLGRYDIRCNSLEDLQQGADFYTVELNGVTSEPAHMYDPKHSVFYAWKLLAAQWSRAYRMAAQNVQKGYKPLSSVQLLQRVRASNSSSKR
ncbi:hypothetical protein OAI07_00190 [Akkermansiaceae bacterium]|nr:hypothetical protein [Akkermansiaceae bacterium]